MHDRERMFQRVPIVSHVFFAIYRRNICEGNQGLSKISHETTHGSALLAHDWHSDQREKDDTRPDIFSRIDGCLNSVIPQLSSADEFYSRRQGPNSAAGRGATSFRQFVRSSY